MLAVGLRPSSVDSIAGITSLSRSFSNAAKAGAAAKTFPSGRSFFCARPLGMTTIIGTAFPSAIRLSRRTFGLAKRCHSVSSPPMPCSRYRTGYFFSVE